MKNKILSGSNWCLANYSLHLAVDRIGCLQDNIPKSHRRVRFACNNKIIIYDTTHTISIGILLFLAGKCY